MARPPRYVLVCASTGTEVARVTRMSHWLSQGIGLLGRSNLAAGEGIWLPGVATVHTVFMRFPIDLLFLDAEMTAVRIELSVPSGLLCVNGRGARHTLELGAGTLNRSVVSGGQRWDLRSES